MIISPVSSSNFPALHEEMDAIEPSSSVSTTESKLFYNKLMESMALQIVREMQQHNEALKKAWQKQC